MLRMSLVFDSFILRTRFQSGSRTLLETGRRQPLNLQKAELFALADAVQFDEIGATRATDGLPGYKHYIVTRFQASGIDQHLLHLKQHQIRRFHIGCKHRLHSKGHAQLPRNTFVVGKRENRDRRAEAEINRALAPLVVNTTIAATPADRAA